MPGFWGWSNPSPKQGQSGMTNKGNFTTSFRNLFRSLTILFLYLIRISFITISAYCFLPPYTPVWSQGFDSISMLTPISSDVNSHCIVVENKMPPPYSSHPSLLKAEQTQFSLPPVTGDVLHALDQLGGPLLDLTQYFSVFLVLTTQYTAYL